MSDRYTKKRREKVLRGKAVPDLSKNPDVIERKPGRAGYKYENMPGSDLANKMDNGRFLKFLEKSKEYDEFLDGVSVRTFASTGWIKKINQVIEFLNRNDQYLFFAKTLPNSMSEEYADKLVLLRDKVKKVLKKLKTIREQIELVTFEDVPDGDFIKYEKFNKGKKIVKNKKEFEAIKSKRTVKDGHSY